MEEYALGALAEPLCHWYEKNKRSMPWRDEPEPYHVWLSEIMLQQTRIEAVKGYYERFLKRLPTVEDLAEVGEGELLKLWEGLGYYNRARNLQKTAKILVENYGGNLPAKYDLLMELPGIGSYTAGAIASIAYGVPAPAVDGNVLRVLMRVLDCRDDITKIRVRKKMERSVMKIIPADKPGDFNQALMELGEMVCIPNGEPACGQCPLSSLCRARARGCQMELPVRPEKKARRIEKMTVLICERDGRFGIIKRPEQGLLAGMWGFPALEGHRTLPQIREFLGERGIKDVPVSRMESGKHIFSHVEWHMRGYRIGLPQQCSDVAEHIVWADRESLTEEYAIPVAYHSFLRQLSG